MCVHKCMCTSTINLLMDLNFWKYIISFLFKAILNFIYNFEGEWLSWIYTYTCYYGYKKYTKCIKIIDAVLKSFSVKYVYITEKILCF